MLHYNYSHEDLHFYNILIRKFEKDININIYDNDINVIGELKTKYIPYIIDYGSNMILNVNKKYHLQDLEFFREDVLSFTRPDVKKLFNNFSNLLDSITVKNNSIIYSILIKSIIELYNIPIDESHFNKYVEYTLDQFKTMVT